jgi:hypothetical protein
MKKQIHAPKKLQLNATTVRTLEQNLDVDQLKKVVGGHEPGVSANGVC